MKIIEMSNNAIKIMAHEKVVSGFKINDILDVIDNCTGRQYIYIVRRFLFANDDKTMDITEDICCTIFQNTNAIAECDFMGMLEDGIFKAAIDAYFSLKDYCIEKINNKLLREMFCNSANNMNIGIYSDYQIKAGIDANKLFQRHSAILGNTGSGKSETIAKILEEINKNSNKANVILFDMHGEYSGIKFIKEYEIDKNFNFPFNFFTLKDIINNILYIKEETATSIVPALKQAAHEGRADIAPVMDYNIFGTEQPSGIDIFKFKEILEKLNSELINTGEMYKTGDKKGQEKTIKGEYYGKLTSVINQINAYGTDIRYRFLFDYVPDYDILEEIIKTNGIKSINFSKIPHDIAITIIGALTKLIYQYQINSEYSGKNNPILLVCDEAHIYIPSDYQLSNSQKRITKSFEEIAKEGRKFGITLMVASQRPSELNKTIVAQCANFIVLKLNNENDKQLIKNLLPSGNENIIENTATFNSGDCFIIGDATPMPLKIHIDLAEERLNSNSLNIWDLWKK